jgi:uncharacterized protein YndB with AHSA1/START domain
MTTEVQTAPVKHDGFTIERTFKSAPSKVFHAFADGDAKQTWFGADDSLYKVALREFDFREGGEERIVGHWHNGFVSDCRIRYHEIIPNERIVYAYEMVLGGKRASVSLSTVEIFPHGTGARLKLTEQGAYLLPFAPSGDDNAERKRGTNEIFDMLAKAVDG